MTEAARELAFGVLMEMADAHKRGAMPIWTIYDRPRDYPDGFIARMHEVPGGATDKTLKGGTIEDIRKVLWQAGLMKLGRQPGDEPQIVESWF